MQTRELFEKNSKFNEKDYKEATLDNWSFRDLEEDIKRNGVLYRKCLLTQFFKSKQNGIKYDIKTPVLVPYGINNNVIVFVNEV